MANKKMKELSALSIDELQVKVRENEKNWFDATMKKATGQLENTASLWKIRKEVARIKTLISQKSEKRA
ncbi:MAG: 50S ribosomal protein L29 [Xanthomonadaceae bacterium]|nr:50S ribosomal protein L29 [Xanthomonadaceae bacterium]